MTQLEIHEGIATITMDRAEKRNALSTEMIRSLRERLSAIRSREDTRVVVLQGAGRAFCAGADLAYLHQISEYSSMENYADSKGLKALFDELYSFPLPTIAKVHGPAIAGGCGLATLCDFVVAAREGSLFGYSEVKIGFIPALVSVYLVRKIGETAARRLLLSAENVHAEEALRLGLITHVAADEELSTKVEELARSLTKNSKSAMTLTKDMLFAVQGMSLQAGLEYAAAMNAFARTTDDCKEGLQNFLQK